MAAAAVVVVAVVDAVVVCAVAVVGGRVGDVVHTDVMIVPCLGVTRGYLRHTANEEEEDDDSHYHHRRRHHYQRPCLHHASVSQGRICSGSFYVLPHR